MNELITYDNAYTRDQAIEDIYNGIGTYDDENPTVYSPNAPYELPFAATRERLLDVDYYKRFLNNTISRFRKSRYYKTYKSYLMDMGLNRCAILGNITDDMADIEMHHNFLTIYDIALMITEHVINTVGQITSFDLLNLLVKEHYANRIPIVMLSTTMHQVYHDEPLYFIPPNQTFGKWWELLYQYRYGITIDIARKVVNYINNYTNTPEGNIFANMRQEILSFVNYNEYGYNGNSVVTLNQIEGNYKLLGGNQ